MSSWEEEFRLIVLVLTSLWCSLSRRGKVAMVLGVLLLDLVALVFIGIPVVLAVRLLH